jgi:hypothetical protein
MMPECAPASVFRARNTRALKSRKIITGESPALF